MNARTRKKYPDGQNEISACRKVAVLTYPMLFQRAGGLQNRIRDTIMALKRCGVDIKLINPIEDDISDFDLVHVFSATNGNFRIIQAAKAKKKPVVLSSVLQTTFNRSDVTRLKLCSRITGKISKYTCRTSYDEIVAALEGADKIIALSEAEEKVLRNLYGAPPEKISIVPNAIDNRFFTATPDVFKKRAICQKPFILISGTISEYKNQLGVIKATAQDQWPIVLVGSPANDEYLKECLVEGQGRVTHLGSLAYDDPLLASSYSAASLVVLVSKGEVYPRVVLESLAAGTPFISTKNTGLSLQNAEPAYVTVNHLDQNAIRLAIRYAMTHPIDPEYCRSLVKHLNWDIVAPKIKETYESLWRSADA